MTKNSELTANDKQRLVSIMNTWSGVNKAKQELLDEITYPMYANLYSKMRECQALTKPDYKSSNWNEEAQLTASRKAMAFLVECELV